MLSGECYATFRSLCTHRYYILSTGKHRLLGVCCTRHIEKYLQLKETHPALALEELKKAVWIQYEGHPKSHEYLILLFKLDTAGKATLPQTLAGNKLVLEMVVDNGFSDEKIRLQRRSVERDEQRIRALKAEGKDPDGQYFRFILMPTQ